MPNTQPSHHSKFTRPSKNSLLWRFIFASIIILPILLGIIAFGLHNAFKTSLINAEKDALQAHFYSLIAEAEPKENTLTLPFLLGQPEFNQFDSGLYSWISNEQNQTVWRSPSDTLTHNIQDETKLAQQHPILSYLQSTPLAVGNAYFYKAQTATDSYFVFQYKTIWAFDEIDRHFTFTLAHNTQSVKAELKTFHETLALWLGALVIIIVVSQFIIIRWGLKPLGLLAAQIKKLEEGEASHIKGDYPLELAPIVDNLNTLLEHEKTQRKRYKNTLSDLAHSLKTPLALMRSLIEKPHPDTKNINEQVSRMSDIINHQLRRASSVSTKAQKIQAKTNISQVIKRITNSLNKVYLDKHISLVTQFADDALHNIDMHDAMELLGNILDNAYKYCKNEIHVFVNTHPEYLSIEISDNGKGVNEALRSAILKRGARADTVTPGQGIGLAISIDILSSYDGSLACNQSTLGGAMFIMKLPFKAQPNNH